MEDSTTRAAPTDGLVLKDERTSLHKLRCERIAGKYGCTKGKKNYIHSPWRRSADKDVNKTSRIDIWLAPSPGSETVLFSVFD